MAQSGAEFLCPYTCVSGSVSSRVPVPLHLCQWLSQEQSSCALTPVSVAQSVAEFLCPYTCVMAQSVAEFLCPYTCVSGSVSGRVPVPLHLCQWLSQEQSSCALTPVSVAQSVAEFLCPYTCVNGSVRSRVPVPLHLCQWLSQEQSSCALTPVSVAQSVAEFLCPYTCVNGSKQTLDRLLKKQETKTKGSKGRGSRRSNVPRIRYVSSGSCLTLSLPQGHTFPLPSQVAPKMKAAALCGVEGCTNPKKYACSQTRVPVCSLQCYQRNRGAAATWPVAAT
ncbi:hypothetical protein ACOMHN_048268 [Nucella lapillus]